MELVVNINEVRRLAELKENGNWKFRTYLKGQSRSKIDRIVHRLNREISSKIDCTKCGNCCKSLLPELDSEDIEIFSNGLSMKKENFVKEFLLVSPDSTNRYEFNSENDSCPFLDEKHCSNYKFRPKDCQSYPHLHNQGFISRTIGVINNTHVCPIVFNVVETLKIEIGFR